MNVKQAAAACRTYIDNSALPANNAEFSKEYLHSLINVIESGVASEQMADRWLGLVQGILVSCGACTLRDIGALSSADISAIHEAEAKKSSLVFGPVPFSDSAALKKINYVMTKVNGSAEDALIKAFNALDDEIERIY